MTEQWLTVMRAIDKLDRLGISGVQQLLGDRPQGRRQGDFTKGAGLKPDDIALVVGAIEQGAPDRLRGCATARSDRKAATNSTRSASLLRHRDMGRIKS